MRIVYFIEDIGESGGVERTVAQKASALADDYAHEVTILSAYETVAPIRYHLSPAIKLLSLGIKRSRRSNPVGRMVEKLRIFVQCVLRLRRVLPSLDADVVFFLWVLGAMVLPFANTRGRRVFESHLSRSFTPYKPFLWLMERSADTIVALTQGDAAEYRHCKDVRVISNFITLPEKTVSDYTQPRAIAVGRLMPVKGFDRLIRIWKLSGAQEKGWTLNIFGIGPMRAQLQTIIEQCGMERSINLCGHSANIMDEYAAHSLHLMTSHAEGQPMTLLEAQSCALPSVVFDFDYGASDIIVNNQNGLIIDQDDEQSFAQALAKIISSTELRQQLGTEARRRSVLYTKENILPEWQRLILEGLGS